ncbi:dTDP-glucose 4,6-dehydratase [Gammaproteobacteria bacterium]|nr:dTDP-glucose 4,6-dehydratase [Gammaproteobacteria bacterium]
MKILVTGGAGFIGANLIRKLLEDNSLSILNIDSLTYAANLSAVEEFNSNKNYSFAKIDITDNKSVTKIFNEFRPDKVMHLAAESHVDKSISSPFDFINTNIIGTYYLLNAAYEHYTHLSDHKKRLFMFHHISTDEVYGDLEKNDNPFTENTPYSPNSPYSASKASSDHLVRAWNSTYNLPVVISNCSNNYGPGQFTEKLIPMTITNAIKGFPIPIYGDGTQIRDWLYVDDHTSALKKIIFFGKPGETYNIGGSNEIKNIDLVHEICSILDRYHSSEKKAVMSFKDLITFVDDRPGHDKRYAINSEKIEKELDWKPKEDFSSGIKKTIQWYIDNKSSWLKE